MERRLVPLSRTVSARLVPTGDPIEIPGGSFVTLTQELGGTYTVIHHGNMARIDGKDADALGFEPTRLTFDPPEDGQIDEHQVMEALASVYDPEIPVNVGGLGLIYDVAISGDQVAIQLHGM